MHTLESHKQGAAHTREGDIREEARMWGTPADNIRFEPELASATVPPAAVPEEFDKAADKFGASVPVPELEH